MTVFVFSSRESAAVFALSAEESGAHCAYPKGPDGRAVEISNESAVGDLSDLVAKHRGRRVW